MGSRSHRTGAEATGRLDLRRAGQPVWSLHGGNDAFNATYLQPFVSYTTQTHTTVGLNTESTYDWRSDQWTVPLNLTVSQLLKIGKLPVQFQVGGRWYADAPDGGPDWGLRFAVTFLLP